MLVNLFGELNGPEVIAAFSGAMLFSLTQGTFAGTANVMAFLVSFLMGIVGADTTTSLMKPYLPESVHLGREAGAFVCSMLIISASLAALSYVQKYLPVRKHKGKGGDHE